MIILSCSIHCTLTETFTFLNNIYILEHDAKSDYYMQYHLFFKSVYLKPYLMAVDICSEVIHECVRLM
jgi:hypothetical protein